MNAMQISRRSNQRSSGTEGHRSRNPDERVMKAERVIVAGTLYDLYPDRG